MLQKTRRAKDRAEVEEFKVDNKAEQTKEEEMCPPSVGSEGKQPADKRPGPLSTFQGSVHLPV